MVNFRSTTGGSTSSETRTERAIMAAKLAASSVWFAAVLFGWVVYLRLLVFVLEQIEDSVSGWSAVRLILTLMLGTLSLLAMGVQAWALRGRVARGISKARRRRAHGANMGLHGDARGTTQGGSVGTRAGGADGATAVLRGVGHEEVRLDPPARLRGPQGGSELPPAWPPA